MSDEGSPNEYWNSQLSNQHLWVKSTKRPARLPHIPTKTITILKLKNSWTQSSLCRWVSCDSYKKCHTFCSFAGPIIAIHFRLVSALLSHLEFVKCCCCFTTTTRVVLFSVFIDNHSASDSVFFQETKSSFLSFFVERLKEEKQVSNMLS